ncbi:MAG: hypothetical protein AAGG59_18705 [Bacteroidota bacterium]
MKKVIFIFLIGSLASISYAQDDAYEMKTIFSRKSEIRGFGSFDLKLTDFNEDKALFIGGHGGVILNKKYIFGGGGYGLVTSNTFDLEGTNQELELYGGYGGIILGYIIAPIEIIHVSFPVLLGAGGIEVAEEDAPIVNGESSVLERTAFFVLEPGIEIEINMTRFMRLAIGGGYRFVQGADLDVGDIANEDLSSWSAGVSFKFGKF